MRNIVLKLAFDGTAYHGWLVQNNARSVQQTVQDALSSVLGERPPVTGCSRTDAGVHASEYFCHLKTASEIPCQRLLKAVNAHLPRDIAVSACRDAEPDFHARYSAKAKEYIYYLYQGPAENPFWRKYSLFCPHQIDCEKINRAAAHLCGTHDFKAFCAAHGGASGTVRTVYFCRAERHGDVVAFSIAANGFLYNMVRIIVGTMLEVCRGRLSESDIPVILRSLDRSLAGPTAPPRGLFLNRVFYTGDFLNGEESESYFSPMPGRMN